MEITIAKQPFTIEFIQTGEEIFQILSHEKPKVFTYDLETTGLHVKADKPFVGGICFKNRVLLFHTTYDVLKWFPRWCECAQFVVGHNMPFDLNMTCNIIPVEETLKTNNFLDTQALVLLSTESVSENRGGIILKLKHLGKEYIDPNANYWELALKKKKADLRSAQKKLLTAYVRGVVKEDGNKWTKKEFDALLKVNALPPELQEVYDVWNEENPPPTYADIPTEILYPYLAVDVILTLLLYRKTIPIVKARGQVEALKIESKIIPVTVRMGRVGLDVDREYLMESKEKMEEAIEKRYTELYTYTEKLGFKFTVSQHVQVKAYYLAKGIKLEDSESATLKKYPCRETELITQLRTMEKWLSTYIKKILRDSEHDGRFYSLLQPFKAVSGRFSGDSQQFPKFPLEDDDGSILFNSRRAFVGEWVFQDFSQVELRVAGHWTTFFGYDKNLCKAYMPYLCHHYQTNVVYNPKDYDMRDMWKELRPEFSWEQLDEQMKEAKDKDPRNYSAAVKYGWSVWIDPDTGTYWKQTDLHQETANKAISFLLENGLQEVVDRYSKKEWRQLGKRANFLLLYQGTVKALMEAIDIPREVAEALYNGFKVAFPHLIVYAKNVTKRMNQRGFCENIYGRKYYLSDPSQFYCIANYLIQGTCGYDLKAKMIRIDEYLRSSGAKTQIVLCIHDEIIFTKVAGEEHHIAKCVEIMEDSSMLNMPLVSEKEVTDTFWSAKKAA